VSIDPAAPRAADVSIDPAAPRAADVSIDHAAPRAADVMVQSRAELDLRQPTRFAVTSAAVGAG
jgi:hypothetical protein